MPFKPVLLWSDAMLWLLAALIAGGAVWAMRREYLRQAWHKVGESGVAMASITILLPFVIIGCLDSLHYQPRLPARAGDTGVTYAPEVLSALDALASELRTRREKTYSAPFSLYLFSKENVELPDGRQTRIYPRLKFAGTGLADPGQHRADLLRRAALGFAAGAAFWAGAAALLIALLAGRRKQSFAATWQALRHPPSSGERPIAWGAALAALAVLCALSGPLFWLAGDYHVFGTDKVGQDVFYLTFKAIRVALLIGTLTTLVTLPLAIALGLTAGYKGGRWDDAIQYVYTVLNSIPGVLLIAAMVLMMQVIIDTHPDWFETAAQRADARLLALCFILGVTSWTGLCRLLRGEALKLRELEYVQAARAFGVGDMAIMVRHILPNLAHIVLISLVMDFSSLVLSEAVLSYIGIGVDTSTTSFGTMINAARLELSREPVVWWALAAAFVFMVTLVLAANLLADAVRDAFDPRWRARARPRRVAA
ncbi:MAG: ABC transporter permease [Rhodocyclaceae bacterium]|nr:ABC transporter permease [Rhodocyclaceae bacterium]MBX3667482.1 ABC transporter permease [Rhodocyclaceae bacterium]